VTALRQVENEIRRLGVVSFLNAKPLIEGLGTVAGVKIIEDVPARLPPMLDEGLVDVALVPVIDLVQGDRYWKIVSDACIASDGETLTVRVFSRVPRDAIRRLHVDADSHTSVALSRVLWSELYSRELEILPFDGSDTAGECEAVLLIGDKVVNNTLIDFDVQTDLGSAWKLLTSLPFVFAVWAARRDYDIAGLNALLAKARDAGVASAEAIAAVHAPRLNWPVALAKKYLTKRLRFTLGVRERMGLARFFELAGKHGLVQPRREVVFA